ncbi:hypothetical protein [Paraprevotella xylaniphila]|mgnify:CR=1 FL=1|uniref:hypothetical protein n=1 Tax=Paraprevotella xylaniphila TaxID=454155 RepID=UPI0023EFD177|nr:hypothetical protein [Paraprevotella xylaniphila]
MKNRLLALMALCTATSSTLPLWAADWADPKLTFVEPDLEGIKGGQKEVYYVYHVASEKFMSNGADFNTTFIVSNTGQEVTLSYGPDYELITHAKDANDYSAAESYRLSLMNAPTNGGFHEVFLDPGVKCYVDHNKQGHILWDIVSQGNGLYRIRVNADDPTYGTNKTENAAYKNTWMGVNPNTDGTWNEVINPLIVPGTSGYEKAEFDWKFVEPEVYEVYAAKKNVLKPQLEAADEAGYTDYAKYKELYESADATVEQIEEAAEELKDAVLEFRYSSASEATPADLTAKITNASFGDGSNGWTSWRANNNNNFGVVTKKEGEIGTSDGFDFRTFFERWIATPPTGDYYIEQSLSELPDGKYRLKAYIMTQQTAENGGPKGLFLYAKTVAGESKKEADVPSPDGTPYAAPYTVDFSVIGGTATVGMRSEGSKDGWSAVGYFTLQYMGKAGAITMRDALNQNITEAEKQYKEEISLKKHSKEGDKKYEEMIALAKAAVANDEVKDDSLQSIAKSLQLRMDSLVSDVAAYQTLTTKTNDLSVAWDESIYADQDFLDYEEYLVGLEEAYNQGTFDPTEVDSIQPRADRIWKACILDALETGDTDNVTGLLTNPNFTGNTNGWTYQKLGGPNNDGLKYGNNVAECYEQAFDVYQEVNGLPAGTYEVSVQGFYRPAGNATWSAAWGVEGDATNDVLAYVYGNDGMVKLPHVADGLQDENIGEDCAQLTAGGADLEGKYVCNGKKSAELIMADGTSYLMTVKCYVGEDGKLRFGVKMPTAPESLTAYWTLFDNFQVTYLGADDMSGAKSAMEALIGNAQELLNKEALTTQEAKDGLNKAIEAATAVVDNLTPETYKEHSEALNAAMEIGQEAIDAATALETKNDNHADKLGSSGEGSYEDYADTEGYAELDDVVLEIDEKISGDGIFASMEEIADYNVKLDKAYTKMMSGKVNFSEATKDKPVDATNLIMCPSFQSKKFNADKNEWEDVRAADGWVNASIEDGPSSKVTSALNYEMFNDSSEIHQTLYNMPAGYYRVVYNGFYRAGGYIDAAVARRDNESETLNAEVYLKGKETNWTNKLASIFDNVKEYKYDSGDVVLPDSLFPDMTDLLYHCIVNGVNGAKAAFEDGAYEGNFSFRVEEGEEPVLGVRKTGKITNDWTCFDNFKLLYYGDGDANKPDDFVSSVEETVADGKATVVSSAWYTINGVRVAEPKQRGIYIRQDKMSDGTTRSLKVMVR